MTRFLLSLILTVAVLVVIVEGTKRFTSSLPLIIASAVLGLVISLPLFSVISVLVMPLQKVEDRIAGLFDGPAAKAARRSFAKQFPDEHINHTTCIDEPNRYVVGVFYNGWRPPQVVFFSVDKASLNAVSLEDDEKYWPKEWR